MQRRSRLDVGRAWAFALVSCVAVSIHAQTRADAGEGSADWHYRINEGDTLAGIAAAYLVPSESWRSLQRLNDIGDPLQLVPGATLRIPLAWLRPAATLGRVVFVRGDARLQRGPHVPRPLTEGDVLLPGDRVRTAPQAALTLRFGDGSRLLVDPGTEFAVERLLTREPADRPGIRLELERGGTESLVPRRERGARPSYEIRTPATNLGVRGTEFRARVEPTDGGTRVEVLDGTVGAGLERLRETRVPAGQGTVALPDRPVPAPRPLPAPPALEHLPPRLERLPLALQWGAVPDAAGYRADVAPAAASADAPPLLTGRLDTPAWRIGDLPDGDYRVSVRTRGADGLEGRAAERTFTVDVRPEPPFTTGPRDGARVRGTEVEMAWTATEGIPAFRLQVAGPAGFGAPVLDRRIEGGPRHVAPLAAGDYRWRVAAIAPGDEQGPFGDAQGFALSPEPPPPGIEAPAADDAGLRFRWRQPEPGQQVQFQLARDAAFRDVVVDQRTAEAEALWAEPQPGTYLLRARTIEADGYVGPWGPPQRIEVPAPRPSWWLLLPAALFLWLL